MANAGANRRGRSGEVPQEAVTISSPRRLDTPANRLPPMRSFTLAILLLGLPILDELNRRGYSLDNPPSDAVFDAVAAELKGTARGGTISRSGRPPLRRVLTSRWEGRRS